MGDLTRHGGRPQYEAQRTGIVLSMADSRAAGRPAPWQACRYLSDRSSVSAPGALVFTDSMPCIADSLLS